MKKHQPRRKNIRLHGYDYRQSAYYFVTICVHQRAWLFEDPDLHQLLTNMIAHIPNWPAFEHVFIDAFVVMPNHIHVIFAFTRPDNATDDFEIEAKRLAKSLGSLIASFKSEVTKRVRRLKQDPDLRVWQRGYYDRIIRDEPEHQRIREYIRLNPERWEEDTENLMQRLDRMLGKMEYHAK